MLLRFSDILADRIERLNACFAKAIARYNYQGVYRGVYPIKVNQQKHLVEELAQLWSTISVWLRSGLKARIANCDRHAQNPRRAVDLQWL
jgi:arginine decarboxylase